MPIMRRFLNAVAILPAIVILLSAVVMSVRGQEMEPEMKFDRDKTLSGQEKKTPTWWHKPQKETPAAQLAHAARLEIKDQKKAAAKAYLALVCSWRDAPEASTAQYKYAIMLEELGKSENAFNEYQYLIENYPGKFDYNDVLDRQFKIANHLRTTPRGKFLFFGGFHAPERALPMYRTIAANAPNWERGGEVRYYMALIEEKSGNLKAAADSYEIVRSKYPKSEVAEDAAFRQGYCLYMEAKDKPRDEQGYRLALSALSMFVADHPESVNAREATEYLAEMKNTLAEIYYQRAEYYDKMAGKPDAAIIAYNDFIKNCPFADTELKIKVNERIKELKASLENKP